MLALKVVLQLIALAAAVAGARLDYVDRDRRTNRHKIQRTALFVLLALGGAGGIVATIVDDLRKADDIAHLTRSLAATQGALEHTSAELTSVQGDLRRTRDAMTGGASFPYLTVIQGRLFLVNDGDDPLYDISIRIWSPADYNRDLTAAQWQRLERRAYHFNLPAHPPHSARDLGKLRLQKGARPLLLAATLLARNGLFSERLFVDPRGLKWAYKVFRGHEAKKSAQLLERGDPTSLGAIAFDSDG